MADISHYCNSSKLRRQIVLDSGNDKSYQTAVAKSPTDTISEWLNVIHVQMHFAATSFHFTAFFRFIHSIITWFLVWPQQKCFASEPKDVKIA